MATSLSSSTLGSVTFDNVAVVPVVAAPTFSPGTGTYTSAQTVTISTTTTGASIRYTTDGSTPSETNGTVYSGAITVASSTTIQASFTDSAVASATYSIGTSGGLGFVTSKTLGTLRNDFSGWVGMEVTVGGSPITVLSLGRIDVSGNTGSHTVKIYDANAQADVSGGSVSVGTSGAPIRRFHSLYSRATSS